MKPMYSVSYSQFPGKYCKTFLLNIPGRDAEGRRRGAEGTGKIAPRANAETQNTHDEEKRRNTEQKRGKARKSRGKARKSQGRNAEGEFSRGNSLHLQAFHKEVGVDQHSAKGPPNDHMTMGRFCMWEVSNRFGNFHWSSYVHGTF